LCSRNTRSARQSAAAADSYVGRSSS
jgi:hypothetical protein